MSASNYYVDGFFYQKIKQGEQHKEILSLLQKIGSGDVKDGFSLEEKYARSKDLRPNVYSYDPVFIDFLDEQNVRETVRELTGQDLDLVHIQLRHSFPGKSYMIWHRDTSLYGGRRVGNIPPAHKMIFYPSLGSAPVKKLSVIPKSHRFMPSSRIVDQIYARISKKKTINSSDNHLLFFNTSILHNVENEVSPKGSIRVIYSFAHKENLVNLPGGEEVIELYKNS